MFEIRGNNHYGGGSFEHYQPESIQKNYSSTVIFPLISNTDIFKKLMLCSMEEWAIWNVIVWTNLKLVLYCMLLASSLHQKNVFAATEKVNNIIKKLIKTEEDAMAERIRYILLAYYKSLELVPIYISYIDIPYLFIVGQIGFVLDVSNVCFF